MKIWNKMTVEKWLGDEMAEIYLHRFIYKLSKSFVAIFIPLYILEVGFAPLTVVVFYLVYFLFSLIGSVPGSIMSSRLGYKKTSLAASPLVLSYLYILRNMSGTYAELFLAAALGGMGVTVYWMGMNPEVSRSSHREKDDREAGLFYSIPSLSSIVAPLIGAGIIASSGFELLFTVTITAILMSFLPLALTPEHHDGMSLNLREFLSDYQWNDFVVFLVTGSAMVGQVVIWPLFLATVIESSGIGGSGALLALGGAVTSIVAGYLSDRIGRKQVVTFGALTGSATFLGMTAVSTPLTAFIVSAGNGFFMRFVNIPIFGTVMERSEDSDLIEYYFVRELGLNLGRILSLVLLAVMFIYLPANQALKAGFILMALLVLAAAPLGSKMVEE
jgi:MFS family permease